MEKYRTTKGAPYYRPLGGAVHFGERAVEAVHREIREEIGAEITNVHYLATFESIFERKGRLSHWIEFVFTAEFADRSRHSADLIIGTETSGKSFEAIWIDVSQPFDGPLYPDGLLELLTNSSTETRDARREGTSEQLTR